MTVIKRSSFQSKILELLLCIVSYNYADVKHQIWINFPYCPV